MNEDGNSVRDRAWHFRKRQKSEMNDDPIQGEFFTNQSIADRLVRESIQNSLDARINEEQPVSVRFALGSGIAGGLENSRGYFNGLGKHLDATMENNAPGRDVLDGLENNLSFPYLLIEDFNTTGLIGNVEQFSDSQSGEGSDINHFYWFVRNVARSGKRSLEGGSWGVGKYVFPDASKINTFFFLTRRSDDNQTIFMGQAVLKTHQLDTEYRLYPYGHFSEIARDDDHFALPISEALEIQRVKDDFSLERNEETGLSIIIPFPQEGLDRNSLLKAVIRYYFSPILSDRLIVEVSDSADEPLVVNHETAYSIVDEIDWTDSSSDPSPENQRRMFDLVQNHATISNEGRIVAKAPEVNRDPTRGDFEDRFEPTELEDARTRFENGQELAFRIPVWVHHKNDSPKLSHLDLIVQRDVNLSETHTEYVRNYLTIPSAGPRRLGISSNFRSLMIVEDENLAALLRDSEEPSHSRWNERSEKVRDRYDLGASTVRFVNSAVRRIVQCLTVTQEGLHINLLNEFFSIPQDGGGKSPPNPNPPPSPVSPVEVTERQGGFNVRVTDRGGEIPERLQIQVAYEVRRGNPLNRYDTRDFRLDSSEFIILNEKCDVDRIRDNQITVSVREAGARISVIGFDINRDIMVQVDSIGSDS